MTRAERSAALLDRIAAILLDPAERSTPTREVAARCGCSPVTVQRAASILAARRAAVVARVVPKSYDRAGLEAFVRTPEARTTSLREMARRFGCADRTAYAVWRAVHGGPKPSHRGAKPIRPGDGVSDRVAADRISTFYEWQARRRRLAAERNAASYSVPTILRHRPSPKGRHA